MFKRIKIIDLLLIMLYCYLLQPYYLHRIVQIQRVFYYAIILLPILYAFIKHIHKIVVSGAELRLYIVIASFVLTYFAAIVFHNTWDWGLFSEEILPMLLKTLSKCSFFLIWHYLFVHKKSKMSAIEIVLNAVVFYIIGTIIFMLIPSLKEMWQDILIQNDVSLGFSKREEYITRYGFAGFSGFEMSFYVSACFPLVFYCNEMKMFTKQKTVAYVLLLLPGVFFYGRIAIVAFAVMMVVWIFYYFVRNNPFILFKALGVLFFILVVFASVYNFNEEVKSNLSWVMEPVNNYIKYGKLSSLSSDRVKEMYQLFNPSLKTLLFGDGKWMDNGAFYRKTDVWFMRTIYMGGIFFFMLYIFCGLMLVKNMNTLFSKEIGRASVFHILALTLIAVYEIKGGCILYSFIFYYPLFRVYKQLKQKDKRIKLVEGIFL